MAVVVGSGFIGCEPAAYLALRGAAVTLASHEQSPQRKRLGDEVGECTEGWLRDLGVDLRLGVRIEGVEGTDGGLTVNLDDGTPSIREPSSSRPALGPASDSPRRPVSRWTTGSSQAPPCGRASQGSSRWETLPRRTTNLQTVTSTSSTGGTHWSTDASRGLCSPAQGPAEARPSASGPQSATRRSSTEPGETAGTSRSSRLREKLSLSGTAKRVCSSEFSPMALTRITSEGGGSNTERPSSDDASAAKPSP